MSIDFALDGIATLPSVSLFGSANKKREFGLVNYPEMNNKIDDIVAVAFPEAAFDSISDINFLLILPITRCWEDQQ